MKRTGRTPEEWQRDERIGNAGVCPACGHDLADATILSIFLPGDTEEGWWVACPLCVDDEALAMSCRSQEP